MMKKISRKPGDVEYYCDHCKNKISYQEKNLNKLYIESEYNKKSKLCELCNRCIRSLKKGCDLC